MTCDSVRLPNGVVAIVCARGRRRKPAPPCDFCGQPAAFLCDHPVGRKTCDAPICGGCRVSVGADRDLCPRHQTQLELRLEPED